MSLCRVMVMDFTDEIGRFDDHDNFLYGNYDLWYGIEYARDFLNEGYVVDPIGGFDLFEFKEWCQRQLTRR